MNFALNKYLSKKRTRKGLFIDISLFLGSYVIVISLRSRRYLSFDNFFDMVVIVYPMSL